MVPFLVGNFQDRSVRTNSDIANQDINLSHGFNPICYDSCNTGRFGNIPEPEQFQSLVYRVREDRARELGTGPAPPESDAASQLQRLAKLVEDGFLSREEFEVQKRALLGDAGEPPPPEPRTPQ